MGTYESFALSDTYSGRQYDGERGIGGLLDPLRTGGAASWRPVLTQICLRERRRQATSTVMLHDSCFMGNQNATLPEIKTEKEIMSESASAFGHVRCSTLFLSSTASQKLTLALRQLRHSVIGMVFFAPTFKGFFFFLSPNRLFFFKWVTRVKAT